MRCPLPTILIVNYQRRREAREENKREIRFINANTGHESEALLSLLCGQES